MVLLLVVLLLSLCRNGTSLFIVVLVLFLIFLSVNCYWLCFVRVRGRVGKGRNDITGLFSDFFFPSILSLCSSLFPWLLPSSKLSFRKWLMEVGGWREWMEGRKEMRLTQIDAVLRRGSRDCAVGRHSCRDLCLFQGSHRYRYMGVWVVSSCVLVVAGCRCSCRSVGRSVGRCWWREREER